MPSSSDKKATLNSKVPAFNCIATPEQKIRLSELKGKKLVLYFYPRDNTPGCTVEGQDFQAALLKFKRAGAAVFGVSRDSIQSHMKFKGKFNFKFELISDSDETLCNLFDVIKIKTMYGKKARGIERSTFLIDEQGVLRKEWRKVKVKEHVDEVLLAVKAL